MPIIVSGSYPSVESILSLARSIVNDAFAGATGTPGEGRILTDNAAFTLPYLNSALRKMARVLRNNGVSTVIKDNWIMTPVLPVQNIDPTVQTFLSWSGYFDGTNMWPSPYLPPDLIVPLELWERVTGTNFNFMPMNQPQAGLNSRPQGQYLYDWEWRQDQINFIGSQQSADVRMRYLAQTLVPIEQGSDFSTTTINMIDCDDAIAYEIAAMYATARGSMQIQQLRADRDEAIANMVNSYVRRQQEIGFIATSYGNEEETLPGSLTGWG
jgi:hypothetical protein